MAGRRDKQVDRYLRREVAAYSAWHRARLGARPRLAAAPLMTLADVDDPAALVLRPTIVSIRRAGARSLRARMALAFVTGRMGRFNDRVVEHRFKPLHWLLNDGVAVGYSEADLTRLGELGARWLSIAGVHPSDTIVGVAPAGPHLAFWALASGARAAGVPALLLGADATAEQVRRHAPTVLAGQPMDVLRLLREGCRPRLVLAIGEPLGPGLRARLAEAAAGAPVVAAWAPPGVRALWGECAAGDGFHTWPTAEALEVVDPLSGQSAPPGADGEVVWTALGWRGTVCVRLRTGAYGAISAAPCRHCGQAGPILHVSPGAPAFLAALDHHPGVAGWQAELSTVGGVEELVVFLALADGGDVGAVCRALDEHLSATQYVVLDAAALDARVRDAGDSRVLDRRSL